MEMIEVKTAELIGPALDWSTAKASETKIDDSRGKELRIDIAPGFQSPWVPSVNWYQGGPFIDQFRFCFDNAGEHGFAVVKDWYCGEPIAFYPPGKTHLIAACRAIVSAKLGDTVSVPKELMQ